jgi:hypothetical protein
MAGSERGFAMAVEGRSGYWDVDRCAWVGARPRYVVPPWAERAAEPAEERSGDVDVPRPRGGSPEPAVSAPSAAAAG